MKNTNRSNGKVNLYQVVTNQIIELLENQKLTWNIPWVMLDSDGKRAHNALTQRTYSGLNQILLSINQIKSKYSYGGWVTFNQIRKAGGHVISGEKSSQIFFNQIVFYDKNGKRYDVDQVQKMTANEQEQHITTS